MTTKELYCSHCGNIQGVPEAEEKLQDLYSRLKSGVQNYEALTYSGNYIAENCVDEEDFQAINHAMERDMHNRGLCPKCGQPDLRGKTADDFYTEEEAQDMAASWAEQAAERRMGA